MISPKEEKKLKKYFTLHKPHHLNLPCDVNLVVVIPVLADFMIYRALESLKKSLLSVKSKKVKPAVIVVINNSEKAPENLVKKNKLIEKELNRRYYHPLQIEIITAYELKHKLAGVGIARKIGMDAAAFHFFKCGIEEGILVSLDADTIVADNYFEEIYHAFTDNQELSGVSLHYEHVLPKNDDLKSAIVQYELHLRYYVNMLRKVGFPFAFHTIGSAFAVRYISYVRQNGMPVKQGGEDFYFLNKVMTEGNFADLTTATVYPSARATAKTPFGTGKAVLQIVKSPEKELFTYNPKAFYLFGETFFNLESLFKSRDCGKYMENLELPVNQFLSNINFCKKINLILSNTNNFSTFKKAFYTWFDGFKAVKFLNFLHSERYVEKVPVKEAITEIIEVEPNDLKKTLYKLRNKDRNNSLYLTKDLELIGK